MSKSLWSDSKYYKDSGSQYILNSAAGVTFPIPIDPPRKIIFSIFDFVLGNSCNKWAKFVKGPSDINVTF